MLNDVPDQTPKRVVNRVYTRESLANWVARADRLGRDLIDTIIFAAVWTANTEHLFEPNRYATLLDLPPDNQRRSISLSQLAQRVRMPIELVRERVERLAADDLVEVRPSGVVVPSAVLARPDMLEGAEANYRDAQRLVGLLGAFGVQPL